MPDISTTMPPWVTSCPQHMYNWIKYTWPKMAADYSFGIKGLWGQLKIMEKLNPKYEYSRESDEL